jgi:hypothetical protein
VSAAQLDRRPALAKLEMPQSTHTLIKRLAKSVNKIGSALVVEPFEPETSAARGEAVEEGTAGDMSRDWVRG